MGIFKIYTRAIILNEKNEVLLLQKNFNQKYGAGKILLPGGTVDFSEEIEKTLVREIKEETNLEVIFTKILDTKTMIIGEEHWLGVYYFAKVKDLKTLKNMEPEKHIFCEFKNIFEMKEDFLYKDFIKNFIKTC